MQVVTCIAKTYSNYSKLTKPTRSYGEETRERILRAAEKLFARDGFQGATTREIADEAKVHETTLFRHFRTRDELLRETILSAAISPEELIGPPASWKKRFARTIGAVCSEILCVAVETGSISQGLGR